MRVLVACEFSGIVRDAFIARGHDAISCDIIDSKRPGPHIRGDVRSVLNDDWDMMVAFPPCTDLSVINASHWTQKQADGRQEWALNFIRRLMDAPIYRIAIENPVGRISTAIRKPDQIIQPYWFGHPWRKRTCLWLKHLPPLYATRYVVYEQHWVDGGNRTRNGAGSVSDEHFGSKTDFERSQHRSMTFTGIAEAMASQWG